MARTFALVAGEASGDQLGAALIEALRAKAPGARFVGVGGERMRAAGFEAWWDCGELAVMGLTEVVRHIPRLLALRRQLRDRIVSLGPDALIGIDAPDFNLGLEKRVRRAGVKTVHYVSPTVWAWRQKRAQKIRNSAGLVLCLFPFEPGFYAGHGVTARYVGHPLADRIGCDHDPADAAARLGLAPAEHRVALLPGSRHGEVSRLAEPLLDAALLLHRRRPGLRFVAPMASASVRASFGAALDARPDLPCTLVDGQALDAMAAADVVVCASGTATLECLLVNRPMVVVYRLASTTYGIGRAFRLVKSEHVALPNILAGEGLVPELIQGEANAARIAGEVEAWLERPDRRQRLSERFDEIHRDLRLGAADRAATEVLAFLDGPG